MLGGIAFDKQGSDGGQMVAIIDGVLAVGVVVAGQGRLVGVEAKT